MNDFKSVDQVFNNYLADLKELIAIPSVYCEDETDCPFGKPIDDALKKSLKFQRG